MAIAHDALLARLPRCGILVVGDFRTGAAEALALRRLGARVFAVGLTASAARREMEAHGIATGGLVRSRKAVADTAAGWLGAADAALFITKDWESEFQAVLEAERESAAMDGRSLRPLLWRGDPRYRFLRSPAQWAAFAAALAAGADVQTAKEFQSRQTRGHANKNPQSGIGRRSRSAAPKRRRAT